MKKIFSRSLVKMATTVYEREICRGDVSQRFVTYCVSALNVINSHLLKRTYSR